MLHISRLSNGKPVSLSVISKKTSISRRYLEQVIIPLKNASLLKGMSGRNGGYVLAKPKEQIRVGEIVEAAIGKISIVDCVSDPDTCMMADLCECRPLYNLINNKILEAMNEFTLADLSDTKWIERITAELESGNNSQDN